MTLSIHIDHGICRFCVDRRHGIVDGDGTAIGYFAARRTGTGHRLTVGCESIIIHRGRCHFHTTGDGHLRLRSECGDLGGVIGHHGCRQRTGQHNGVGIREGEDNRIDLSNRAYFLDCIVGRILHGAVGQDAKHHQTYIRLVTHTISCCISNSIVAYRIVILWHIRSMCSLQIVGNSAWCRRHKIFANNYRAVILTRISAQNHCVRTVLPLHFHRRGNRNLHFDITAVGVRNSYRIMTIPNTAEGIGAAQSIVRHRQTREVTGLCLRGRRLIDTEGVDRCAARSRHTNLTIRTAKALHILVGSQHLGDTQLSGHLHEEGVCSTDTAGCGCHNHRQMLNLVGLFDVFPESFIRLMVPEDRYHLIHHLTTIFNHHGHIVKRRISVCTIAILPHTMCRHNLRNGDKHRRQRVFHHPRVNPFVGVTGTILVSIDTTHSVCTLVPLACIRSDHRSHAHRLEY